MVDEAGEEGPGSDATAAPGDVLGQVQKLGELREAGILTQEEFESKKAELLSRL